MKKLSLIAGSLLLLAAASCTKNTYYTSPVDQKPVITNPNYIIEGLSDVNLFIKDSTIIPITITYKQGVQKRVTVSLMGVPQGLNYSITPNAGLPTFTANIGFGTKHAPAGTYMLQLLISDSVKTDTIPFQVTVKKHPIFLDNVVGTYNSYSLCQLTNDTTQVTVFKMTPTSLGLFNFLSSSTTVTANVDTVSKGLTIPMQSLFSGNMVGGSGMIYDDSIVVNYGLYNSSMTLIDTCHAVMKQP